MRIMLVEDTLLVREGIATILRLHGHEIVAEAGTGAETLEAVKTCQPELVLLDVRLPDTSGIDLVGRVKERHPNAKIVMLTVSDDQRDVARAIESGADGYLVKDLTADQLAAEVDAIARGESVISDRLRGRLFAELRERTEAPAPEALTPRQEEILDLATQGLDNSEIGERLIISRNTVKYHLRLILENLHVHSRGEAIAWWARHRGASSGPRDELV